MKQEYIKTFISQKSNHQYAKLCIRYNLPKTINYCQNEILDKVTTHSLQGFSKYAKQLFLKSYQDTCTIQNCYICNH